MDADFLADLEDLSDAEEEQQQEEGAAGEDDELDKVRHSRCVCVCVVDASSLGVWVLA